MNTGLRVKPLVTMNPIENMKSDFSVSKTEHGWTVTQVTDKAKAYWAANCDEGCVAINFTLSGVYAFDKKMEALGMSVA